MNDLQVFNYEGASVRVIDRDGEPWFVGKDVAEVLGYSNNRKAIGDHVDEEDKGVTKRDTLGGSQNPLWLQCRHTTFFVSSSIRYSSELLLPTTQAISSPSIRRGCLSFSKRLSFWSVR